jgi:hypothetical protein
MKRALFVGCLGVAIGAWAGEVRAQEVDHRKAVQAFTTARAAIDAGDCKTAVPKLRESLAYEPSVGAHLSMADCYESIDLLAAWSELKEAEHLASDKNDDRAGVARARAASMEPKLATVRLTSPGVNLADPAVEARLDGNLVVPFLLRDGLVAATPGAHTVEVSVPGKKPWRRRVALSSGVPVAVQVDLENEAPGPPGPAAPVLPPAPEAHAGESGPPAPLPFTPPPSEGSPGTGQRVVGVAAGVVGVAALAVGGAFGVTALAKNSDVRSACGGNVQACTGDPATVEHARDDARTAATVSTVGLVAGGVLAAAGVVVYLTAPSRNAPRVGLGGIGGNGPGVGVSLGGAW